MSMLNRCQGFNREKSSVVTVADDRQEDVSGSPEGVPTPSRAHGPRQLSSRVQKVGQLRQPGGGRRMRIKVVLTVDVDPSAWVGAYGPADVNVGEDVRRYVGGALATTEATRLGAIVGVDVKCLRPSRPTEF
jgi:hypothetical protein